MKKYGGYGLKEKAVNEDWNFWLKLLSIGKYPVHMSYYGQWYRRKENGELKKAKENQKKSKEKKKKTASKVTKIVNAVQYPKQDYNYDLIPDIVDNIKLPKTKTSNKINILMFFPWMITGGADRFNLSLINRLDKEKYNVIVILTEPNKNVLRQEFEKHAIVYDLTSFIDQKYWLAFVNYIIEKEDVNVIFNSNSKFGYYVLPYLKARYSRLPIIDYIHMEEWYNRNGGYSRYSSMLDSIIDKTLVCNENSKNILQEHFGRREEDIKTVYVGVDEDEFDPAKYNKEKLLEKYSLDKNKHILSYICRISEQKRPILLLAIINKLKEVRKDFKVLVVGEGNLLQKMKVKAKELNLDEYIQFLGNIEQTEEIYKISDLTINCSIKEGIALTSYESLSMGVPIVSSNVGGQAELIDENTGILITCWQNEKDIYKEEYNQEEVNDFTNAIVEILNNLDKYKENCRKRILDNFTLKSMIKNMSKIIEDVYKEPSNEKINNGEDLKNNINITKEFITINMMNDKIEYEWECKEYEKKVYGIAYSKEGLNYKHELIKEQLWKFTIWRKFIKIIHKMKGKENG